MEELDAMSNSKIFVAFNTAIGFKHQTVWQGLLNYARIDRAKALKYDESVFSYEEILDHFDMCWGANLTT